jgi:hypothetical protein
MQFLNAVAVCLILAGALTLLGGMASVGTATNERPAMPGTTRDVHNRAANFTVKTASNRSKTAAKSGCDTFLGFAIRTR